jgi:integrase
MAPKLNGDESRKLNDAKPRKLSDPHIEALREFDQLGVYPDSIVQGLRLRLGVHRATWIFKQWQRKHGDRSVISRTLGTWPLMNVATARKEALKVAGKLAEGVSMPGKRSAVTLETALADYLEYLKAKAERAGKAPRWFYNASKLAASIILPQFGKWSLVELANSPAAVRDWHAETTKKNGPVSSNHAARILRAAYRRAARLDVSLPQRLPTSAVDFNKEQASQKALAFKDYRKWFATWRTVASDVRRAYHLAALLSGCRPGELARVRWSDLKPAQRCLVIDNAKAGDAVTIPLSWPMVRALKIARDAARASGSKSEFIFPGANQAAHRDELPARGNMLRHAFKTVATELKVDDTLSHLLLGHALDGVSRKYISKIIIQSGPALRKEQARISRKILALLGLTSTEFIEELRKPPLPAPPRERKPTKPRGPRKREDRKAYFKTWYAKNQARIIEKRRAERAALKPSHHDAPLVPDVPNRVEATRKKGKAAA